MLQAWLQSLPELVLLAVILYRNASASGPAVIINGPILLQAIAAHAVNLWDKTLLFRSCAAFSGCSGCRQLLLLLGIRGSCRLSLPVLRDNLARVLRGTGGAGGGAELGAVVHLSAHEEVPDTTDSEAVRVCCCRCAGCERAPAPGCACTRPRGRQLAVHAADELLSTSLWRHMLLPPTTDCRCDPPTAVAAGRQHGAGIPDAHQRRHAVAGAAGGAGACRVWAVRKPRGR